MSDYQYLTAAEKDTYNEYTRLRQISDWPGFDTAQQGRKDAAGAWIKERRAYIKQLAEGKVEDQPPGWDVYHRRERYDYLGTTSSGSPQALCQLPTEGATDAEGAYITEREAYWRIAPDYDEQADRRRANLQWLADRRREIWRLANGKVQGEPSGWRIRNRSTRYANLCVATKHGGAYDRWRKDHDATTGAENQPKPPPAKPSGEHPRARALQWMANHRGITEDPRNSNCDHRQDGIRAAQDRCANGTWLRGLAWCGVWCFNALKVAGVQGLTHNMASVAWIEAQARAGRAPFTGWTTDGSTVRPGDLVVLFGHGVHVGMVREVRSSDLVTEEGNTTVGANGGSAQKIRVRASQVYGYARVKYPN